VVVRRSGGEGGGSESGPGWGGGVRVIGGGDGRGGMGGKGVGLSEWGVWRGGGGREGEVHGKVVRGEGVGPCRNSKKLVSKS